MRVYQFRHFGTQQFQCVRERPIFALLYVVHSWSTTAQGHFSVYLTMGDTTMATFDQRIGTDGKTIYRVRVRRKGYATQTAIFSKLSEAKKWAQITEGAIFEGRHFNVKEAKRHTVADLIDRYLQEILPHKSHSSIYMQTLQLK
jgi:hypothetical protein